MKRYLAAALLVAVALSAFAGTCILRNVKITVIDDHDTYGAELFNDSGANILQHKFVVGFIGPNNNLVEVETVDGCLRSLQNGASDFFSATAGADSSDTSTALSRLALDSTLKLGETADGDVDITELVISRNGKTLTITGKITNRDSDELLDVVACAVVRDEDGNVIIVKRDTSVGDGDLVDNEAGTFSITITVPDDSNVVDLVDIWVDGLDADEDERPIDPVSDLDNAVAKHGDANKLAFTTQPGGTATGGTALTSQPVVKIQDSSGNTVVTSTASVTLAIKSPFPAGTSSPALTCAANPVTAVNGVATFSGCKIDDAGTGYILTATSNPVLTAADSAAFNVTVGAAAKLAFSPALPTAAAATVNLSPQPTVLVQDAGGNTVTTSIASIVLTIGGPGTGVLSCDEVSNTKPAVAGVATFVNCDITLAGTNTITASSAGLTPITSPSIVTS